MNCQQHAAVDWRPKHRAQAKRIRGRALQELRRRLFAASPDCAECLREGRATPNRATIRDHVVSLAEGGTEEPTNIQGLCVEHNEAKTNTESQRGVRRWTAEAYDAQIGQRRRVRRLR